MRLEMTKKSDLALKSLRCIGDSDGELVPGKWLAEKLGIPYVVINGDLNDLRLYSEEQARTQFDALVEQLGQKSA